MANPTPLKPTGAAKLRELLKDPKHTVVAPGVYDGITARLALAAGFEALYMVSSSELYFQTSILLRHVGLPCSSTSLEGSEKSQAIADQESKPS